jgi:hypothetical protein
VPYFYQGTGGFDRTLSDTHSSATRHRHIPEILLSKNDPFDTSDNIFGDWFPINTGFGIVTHRLVGMASHT